MSRGRKELPNEVKKLKGTLRASRMVETVDGPKIKELSEIISVSRMKILKTKRAKQIFKDKANQLISLDILTEIDFESLAIYANSLDMLFDCIEEISKGKFSEVNNEAGKLLRIVPNPHLKLYREMVEICNKIGSDFGFSPVSRLRLHSKSEDKNNPFEELMKQFNT